MALARLEAAFGGRDPEVWNLQRIGLAPEATGKPGSPTVVLKLSTVKHRKICEFIEGDAAAKADELVRRLVDGGLIG